MLARTWTSTSIASSSSFSFPRRLINSIKANALFVPTNKGQEKRRSTRRWLTFFTDQERSNVHGKRTRGELRSRSSNVVRISPSVNLSLPSFFFPSIHSFFLSFFLFHLYRLVSLFSRYLSPTNTLDQHSLSLSLSLLHILSNYTPPSFRVSRFTYDRQRPTAFPIFSPHPSSSVSSITSQLSHFIVRVVIARVLTYAKRSCH